MLCKIMEVSPLAFTSFFLFALARASRTELKRCACSKPVLFPISKGMLLKPTTE